MNAALISVEASATICRGVGEPVDVAPATFRYFHVTCQT